MSDQLIDYDDPQFNKGVQHVVYMLARLIGASGWVAGDGSEDYDCDLEQTLLNILQAGHLYDAEDCRFASLWHLVARIKRSSKYWGQTEPNEWFDVRVVSDSHYQLRGNCNNYRISDVVMGVRMVDNTVLNLVNGKVDHG